MCLEEDKYPLYIYTYTLPVIYFHLLLVKNKYKKIYTFYNITSVRRVTFMMIF